MDLLKKEKLTVIALVLMLTTTLTVTTLPNVVAQQGPTKKTYPYIGAIPNPVGVDQMVLLHVGILTIESSAEYGWENLRVHIKKPDGTTETMTDIDTDSTGGTGVVFYPSQVGTYELYTIFPEQQSSDGITMLESESEVLKLEVQEDPVPSYPSTGLPDEYWTRPIDAQHQERYHISGSWLTTPRNLHAPHNDGPETAHILWTKPLTMGGLVGGEYGGYSYEIGDAYEGKWTGSSGEDMWVSSSIILDGKLYYQESTQEDPVLYHCVDLRTGEELWTKTFMDNQTIDFGQLFHFDSYNMHGTFPYLWVETGGFSFWGPPQPIKWYAFDPLTGNWMYTMENVPSGTNLYGPNGAIYRYTVDLQNGWMTKWSTREVVMHGLTGSDAGSWGSNAHGNTFNASQGILWNKTIPTGLPGSTGGGFFSQGGVLKIFLDDRIIGGVANTEEVSLWGINLNESRGEIGSLMFQNTWQAPAEWDAGNVTVGGLNAGWVAWSIEDDVGVLWTKEPREHWGFNLTSGEYMWGPTETQYYLDATEDTPASARVIAYGRLYSASVGGRCYCYNATTGERLWTYEAEDPYNEFLFSNNWWLKPLFVTEGKIYLGHIEHSPIDPRPQGAPFICLNATTGEVIWRVNGLFRQTRWGGRAIIGDSVIATMDTYDLRVYGIGKGPSKTTVTAEPKTVAQGSSIVIEGTVTDVSPGTEEYELTSRFPNGVPAVSDEDMGEWMKYVYKLFPRPEDAQGVRVTLDAVGPDGEFVHIGTTSSDTSGTFSYLWQPPDEGQYKIIATFEGSDSYYASYDQTAIGVDPAPDETVSPTEEPAWYEEPVSPTEQPAWYTEPPETVSPTEQPEWYQKPPAYTTVDLAIIAAVIIVAILVIYTLYTVKQQK